MARKKDLGGLAALAGLAYMASRDKAAKGDMPTGDDQYNPDVKQRSAAAPDMGEIRDEAGTLSTLRRNTETGEMYDPTGSSSSAAPSRPAASRSTAAAASKPSTTALKDDQYNADVKLRTSPPASRVGRAGQATVSGESMADSIAREAIAKRRAREAGTSSASATSGSTESMADSIAREAIARRKARESGGEGMKKGGSVKGWGISRGARKAKIY
jgi:hypothetical protein